MPRPSEYNDDVVNAICSRVMMGETLVEICKGEGMPKPRTVYDWLEKYPAFQAAYSRARVNSGQASEAKIREYMRLCRTGELEPKQADVLIKTEMWLAAKRAPRTHGDRVEVEHSGQVNQGLVVNVNVVPAATRACISNNDAAKAIDVQPCGSPAASLNSASD